MKHGAKCKEFQAFAVAVADACETAVHLPLETEKRLPGRLLVEYARTYDQESEFAFLIGVIPVHRQEHLHAPEEGVPRKSPHQQSGEGRTAVHLVPVVRVQVFAYFHER